MKIRAEESFPTREECFLLFLGDLLEIESYHDTDRALEFFRFSDRLADSKDLDPFQIVEAGDLIEEFFKDFMRLRIYW